MAHRTGVLDVRPLPHGQKHAEAFRRFDALGPGEAFVLVSDHEPLGLLREFQAKRPRAFEWNVLETGPETFRIEVERRASATTRNVSEFLGRDHDRLDGLFANARKLAASGKAAEARAEFEEFARGLIRHISMEENVLFPAFEAVTGMSGGPTVVMHHEHRQIGGHIEAALAALAKSDLAAFEKHASDLHGVLFGHNQKEEGVLYPMLDRSLPGEAERDDLVRALQSESALAGCGCCSHGSEKKPVAGGRRLETC